MYCSINLKGHTDSPSDIIKNFELHWLPTGSFGGKFDNFRVRVLNNGFYYLKGSLWKYYHKDNCGSFSISEAKSALEELMSLTGGTILNADVISFEFGVNINVIHNPSIYLEQMQAILINNRIKSLFPSFRHKILWKMESQEWFHNYKFYNKSLESKIKDRNLLRFESKFCNVKGALACSLQLNDLLNPMIYNYWIEDYKKAIRNLILNSVVSDIKLSGLSCKELYKSMLLCRMDTHLLLKKLKENIANQKTYQAERTSIRKLLINLNSHGDLLDEIFAKVMEKMEAAVSL